ncbi:MAG: flagellar hook protein FlgE [Gammaproteobacteria bacterium]|nr:flagellar hook protein FlgE [Gammaproteobacteria bacterium]
MSFNTSLSGLNAAASDLSVTSNNIANVGSIGFKGSRTEFSDVFSATGASNIGSGAQLAAVNQNFNQGNLEFTNNSLDLAISGRGFFVASNTPDGADRVYTRAGGFHVNQDGYVVNSSGQFMQAFPVNPDGTVSSSNLSSAGPLLIPEEFGAPTATTSISLSANFPATAPVLPVAGFDPLNATTYNHSTSATVYDSLGNTHVMTNYFFKTSAVNNSWESRSFLDGAALTANGSETLQFDPTGALTAPVGGAVSFAGFPLSNGADPLTLSSNYSGSTQFSSAFAVLSLAQDGNTTGSLSGMSISEEGLVQANFSNGESRPLGKVALADFRNSQGLQSVGNSAWVETIDSGAVMAGEANNGRLGAVKGGAVEASNVDLTQQLVKLITAQRNFQANAKAIETSSSLTQTIMNI